MRSDLSTYCAQAVYGVGTVSSEVGRLYPAPPTPSLWAVYERVTYTTSIPVFVLAVMHSFLGLFSSVKLTVMLAFHTTNNRHHKFKIRNNS